MKSKKIKGIIVSALAVCLSIPSAVCSAAYELGDMDGNGAIDGKDATAILSYYASISAGKDIKLTADQAKAADVNGSSVIDGVDATTVLSYYASSSVGYSESLQFYVQNKNVPLDNYPAGLEGEDDARAFVSGSWMLLPQGQPEQSEDVSKLTLKLDGDQADITLEKGAKKGSVSSKFSMLNLFDTPRGCYNLIRTVPPTKVEYSSLPIPMNYDGQMDIQFTGANVDGKYVIAMSVANFGISPFQLLLSDYEAAENTWIFEQIGNNVLHKPDNLEHASMRVKGKTFYAYRWLDTGDSVYLQEMNSNEVEVTGQDGNKKTARDYSYPLNGHAMVAVQYPFESDITKTDCNTYRPCLVKVTTDKNGNITELKELTRIENGLYQE